MENDKNAAKKKLVFADYFLAFSTREFSGNADVWRLYTNDGEFNPLASSKGNVQISGDLYTAYNLKDICSTYYPLIGPYDTQDEDVAEYHVLLARAAGIDGFLGEWAYEGMSRDKALINLARVGAKYNFQVGANWCEYGHFSWQDFKDRRESIEAAKRGFVHLLKNVYGPCGARIGGRELVLLFDARPEEAISPKQAFFGPNDIKELREAANEAGYNPLILARNISEGMMDAVDGFFPWMPVSGSPLSDDEHWTMACDREKQVQFLKDFYSYTEQFKKEGKIKLYLGGVWQGFDDHKGQAWGSGEKRYIPRDRGQTLKSTWIELNHSKTDIAMIVTWNDWEEATNIEPSLELGYNDILECARQISEWKGISLKRELLRLPERLFKLRKKVRFLQNSGVKQVDLHPLIHALDVLGKVIAARNEIRSSLLMDRSEKIAAKLEKLVTGKQISMFWEFSVPSIGIELILPEKIKKVEVNKVAGIVLEGEPPELKFHISESIRNELKQGCFIGRLSFEYLDVGTDFIRVYVDSDRETHQVIADFRKRGTGEWMRASLDLVNIRFEKGLCGDSDIIIRQQEDAKGGIRMIRIDGTLSST